MEKYLLSDALQSQKFATDLYNTWTGECDAQELRSAFMSLLQDEHAIQNDIFTIMKSQGFYPLKQATMEEINQAASQVTKN